MLDILIKWIELLRSVDILDTLQSAVKINPVSETRSLKNSILINFSACGPRRIIILSVNMYGSYCLIPLYHDLKNTSYSSSVQLA